MEATRQFMPEEVVKWLTEALTRFGISIDEAIQKIRNAMQDITESVESAFEEMQTAKRERKLFAKRLKAQAGGGLAKYKLFGRKKIKEFWGNHEPP